MKGKKHETDEEVEEGMEDFQGEASKKKPEEESDDDAEWYRKEVGQEPDEDLFDKRKRKFSAGGPRKKFKFGKKPKFNRKK